jgi:CubicO group peptidase (beta-lactamase class C family)
LEWSLAGFTTPLKFAPGDGWYYGTATDWAAQALERITGQTIGAYAQEHVLGPLGMKDTGFWPEKLPHVANRTAEFSFRDGTSLNPGPSPLPREHPVESGGAGLFSTASDYAKAIQAVLGSKLVGEATTDAMFEPQLSEAQSSMLMAIAAASHDMFAPEFPRDMELNWGLAGLVNMEDVPQKRRKGSLAWSGMANARWVSVPPLLLGELGVAHLTPSQWIDRKAGVGAILMVNVLPHGDPVVKTLMNELEKAVYGDLLHGA